MYYTHNVPHTISNNPRLAVDNSTASVIELQTGNAATPEICFYSPAAKKGFILLTTQKSRFGNHGLTISENAAHDNSSFSVSFTKNLPLQRFKKLA